MKLYREINIDIEAELARIPKAYTKRQESRLREFYALFSACKFIEAIERSNKYKLNEFILNECYDVLWNQSFGEVYVVHPTRE
jgi:translation initiation factor 2 beta subunit (eIF-2beta)/eIF-5